MGRAQPFRGRLRVQLSGECSHDYGASVGARDPGQVRVQQRLTALDAGRSRV
jgi:hypothetical protein